MPTPRRCSGCGATLGDPTDDDLTVVCRFCGLRHDLNDLAAGTAGPRTVVIDAGALGRGVGRTARTAVVIVAGVAALAIGMGAYVAVQSSRRLTRQLTTMSTIPADTTRRPGPGRDERLAPAALSSLTQFGWYALDVPPPPGGFAGFEPVAALPWAMEIARAWAADAALTRIDVGHVDTTGVVTLAGEETSGYRFTSPGRQLRWKQETDAGSKSPTRTGLMLQIHDASVRALVEEGRNTGERPPPPPEAILPLPDLLARAKTRGVPDRPIYSGYMIHLPREGWVWYLSAPSGDSFPRARARDGRTYPY